MKVTSNDEKDELMGSERSSILSSQVDSNTTGSQLSERETRKIARMKGLMLFAIVAIGFIVTGSTYRFLKANEELEFETQFDLYQKTVADSATTQIEEIYSGVEDLADSITTSALATGDTFPFVTVPYFESTAARVRLRTGIELMYFAPTVRDGEYDAWTNYSSEHIDWLAQSRDIVCEATNMTWEEYGFDNMSSFVPFPFVFAQADNARVVEATNLPHQSPNGPWEPLWISSPPYVGSFIVNYDIGQTTFKAEARLRDVANFFTHGVFGPVSDLSGIIVSFLGEDQHAKYHNDLVRKADEESNFTYSSRPHSFYAQPVYTDTNDRSPENKAGVINNVVAWDKYFVDVLPPGAFPILAVLSNSCNQSFTYEISGEAALYRGEGDMHSPEFNYLDKRVKLFSSRVEEDLYLNTPDHCAYFLDIYPTQEFKNQVTTMRPAIATAIMALAFVLLIGIFGLYDKFVFQRNFRMVNDVVKTNAIVSSIFPSNVRDRLYADVEEQERQRAAENEGGDSGMRNRKKRLRSFMQGDEGAFFTTKPIADLFLNTTVLFADISGFTAWSSTREPTQVFVLLETIFKAFDDMASRRRGVFKVETVGDCYVAVAGVPDARKDHAMVMCRFAIDCMVRFKVLTEKLEVMLGPDTADLNLRVGLHSGPVTAGVLRGERSRFQLFGDTMNVASRMESNGVPGKIQVSEETYKLLVAADKESWLTPRAEKINAKGKGSLQTYWLNGPGPYGHFRDEVEKPVSTVPTDESSSEDSPRRSFFKAATKALSDRHKRLVHWNGEVMLSLLKRLVAHRNGHQPSGVKPKGNQAASENSSTIPLDEVQEVIELPEHTESDSPSLSDIQLDAVVEDQLVELLTGIASMYKDNAFHNFEHASHVTMSVNKLLSRIVNPDTEDLTSAGLHNYTFGITSDPLTQLACVFSALIHDVDHVGVPNTRLAVENPTLAAEYENTSIAEQNSIDVAWSMLQLDTYKDLRHVMFPTVEEELRFRQLVVNSVMATDIMDKGLKELRNKRWEKAFDPNLVEDAKVTSDRRATIVIEHLIQASDVSHTMQHWHIYRKWNERLFHELYAAYKAGRADKDPSENWYRGEIGFFDFYIIPLAKKLKDCGVFGVSCDEYLTYAMQNRNEWEQRGQEIVAQMRQQVAAAEAM